MIIQKNLSPVMLAALAISLAIAVPASAKLSLANEEGSVPESHAASGPEEVHYAQLSEGGWVGSGGSQNIRHGGGGHHHNHHHNNYHHHGGYRHHGHYGGWYGGYGPGWGWGGWGRPNVGVVVEIPIYPRYRPVYRGAYVGGSVNAGWCARRYRSYRAWDNTFQPFHGPRRYCVSPYR